MRVLQIGDIHLPSSSKSRTAVDTKDARFPVALKGVISAAPIRSVFKKIYSIIERGDVRAVIFVGDLTDYGDQTGFEACANYIARSLQLGDNGIHCDLPVSILPGNHDIKRDLAKSPSLIAKFEPLQEALRKAGFPQFPLQRADWMQSVCGRASIRFALLNSCWGCGSPEFTPEEFRESVSLAIDAALASGISDKAVKAYYDRQFDTPAFADASIQDIASFGLEGENSSLLIACAHHNLLPQRQPRLAPYTELVNSGALRSTLVGLQRPILYLHGHIHDDPIETLIGPEGDPLICVSAPLITEGFNILDFTFTRTGASLSCQLTRWRTDNAGTVRPLAPIVMPLIGHRRRSHDRNLSKLYSFLLDKREVYWDELRDKANEFYSSDLDTQLSEALELLRMDNRVKIDNHDLPSENWIIGATL